MHIKVLRQNQTIFIISEPSDSFGRIRSKLQKIVGVPITQIRIIGPDRKRVMEDEALLSDHNIRDDGVVYMVLQTDGAWEDIHLVPYGAAGGAGDGRK